MTEQIREWVGRTRRKHLRRSGRVLEVGSRDINGNVRGHFKDAKEYIGTDMIAGAGVDKVVKSRNLLRCFKKESFDVVLCLETLEHDLSFWTTVSCLHKLVKVGGVLMITTPTYGFPVHRYPRDYWRFGRDAYEEYFFRGFEILDLTLLHDNAGHPGLCGAGIKR